MRIWSTYDRSLAFALVGDVLIQANAAMVSDDAWRDYIEQLADFRREHHARRLLNYSPTFAPGPTQLTAFLKRHISFCGETEMLSLVTSSSVVRKVINAVAWMLPTRVEIRSYHPDRAGRALDWIFEGSGGDVAEGHRIFETLLAHTGWTVAPPASVGS